MGHGIFYNQRHLDLSRGFAAETIIFCRFFFSRRQKFWSSACSLISGMSSKHVTLRRVSVVVFVSARGLSILVRCITKSICHGQLIIYKNNLLAQLSFFSITQTDDPILLTNFTFWRALRAGRTNRSQETRE